MGDDRVKLKIVGITSGHANKGYYTLLLKQFGTQTKLPIVIGQFEAQSIALEIEGIKSDRPMTHDLIVDIYKSLDAQLEEVFIRDVKEGVFYASLLFKKGDKTIEIDTRTSDAIAISVRENSTIFTTQSVLNKAGILFEENPSIGENQEIQEEKETSRELTFSDTVGSMDLEELNQELRKAIEAEDYLKAAIIRDELKRRNK
ncbi:MAG: bifunctional nuclease domain-containing protein [Bacteroidota bacterium]|nr:bifunctional nuclease domain-containing protein [Bacteroidota bacterium]